MFIVRTHFSVRLFVAAVQISFIQKRTSFSRFFSAMILYRIIAVRKIKRNKFWREASAEIVMKSFAARAVIVVRRKQGDGYFKGKKLYLNCFPLLIHLLFAVVIVVDVWVVHFCLSSVPIWELISMLVDNGRVIELKISTGTACLVGLFIFTTFDWYYDATEISIGRYQY